MALAIATNNAALNAAASASSVNRDMETSMARLSTGKRINSASDDAAGVAISSRLSSEIRGTDQAIRNSLDGQALIDTAEGAHKEIENILQRMREVAVQSANDTNNGQDRANLQAEMESMVTEIDRIAGTTTWAGANLMDDSTGTTFSFQVGAATGSANQINIKINAMSAKALGVGDSDIKYMADPSVTTPVPVGAEFLINTTTEGNQYGPSVTALSDGGFVATWFGNGPGDADGVIGQRFNASGVASGSEFLINTTTESFQDGSSVTTLRDGGFVATWHGNGPGDDRGIVGQRFYAGIAGEPVGVMVTDAASSRNSITAIDGAIQTVNVQRSKLGAVSNRLSHTINNLTNISSNLSAAQGGIEDADFAKETTDLAKNQILQQASTAMLAQANASKQNVLSLLQG